MTKLANFPTGFSSATFPAVISPRSTAKRASSDEYFLNIPNADMPDNLIDNINIILSILGIKNLPNVWNSFPSCLFLSFFSVSFFFSLVVKWQLFEGEVEMSGTVLTSSFESFYYPGDFFGSVMGENPDFQSDNVNLPIV